MLNSHNEGRHLAREERRDDANANSIYRGTRRAGRGSEKRCHELCAYRLICFNAT